MNCRSRSGFSIIEWIVAISVIAIVAGVTVPRVAKHMADSRDVQRLSDVTAIQGAIEKFYADEHRYPAAHANASYGGWDVSSDGDLIPELVQRGYLREALHDPLDDPCTYYAYFVYEKGALDCASEGPFYVLGIKSFETASFAAMHRGSCACPERDWSHEFAYVTCGGLEGRQLAAQREP